MNNIQCRCVMIKVQEPETRNINVSSKSMSDSTSSRHCISDEKQNAIMDAVRKFSRGF